MLERHSHLKGLDITPRIAYWQRLGPEAILREAMLIVEDVHRERGEPIDAGVRKDIERFGMIADLAPNDR